MRDEYKEKTNTLYSGKGTRQRKIHRRVRKISRMQVI